MNNLRSAIKSDPIRINDHKILWVMWLFLAHFCPRVVAVVSHSWRSSDDWKFVSSSFVDGWWQGCLCWWQGFHSIGLSLSAADTLSQKPMTLWRHAAILGNKWLPKIVQNRFLFGYTKCIIIFRGDNGGKRTELITGFGGSDGDWQASDRAFVIAVWEFILQAT